MQTIRGELTFAAAEKIKITRYIEHEQTKLDEIEKDPWYQDKEQQREKIKEEIRKRMSQKNDELKAQEERIDIIKGKLNSQIVTSIRETVVKLTDKELSLTEKLRIIFREQGITLDGDYYSSRVDYIHNSSGAYRWTVVVHAASCIW